MEYKPNSYTERSADIGPDPITRTLSEHFVLNRTITHWDGPKYISYNTPALRLRSFDKQPRGTIPTPYCLSDAGGLYDGKC